ncbi:LytR/AlgR family response regulator transcription factor [Allomuricauda sp. SCSIO 65647]|uniref:LytR/AlgR family response regulator transcription factor n=1 Tax=Allomuricauda sp. SCSIO 65647 TaxID=2908843 RepID=UPI001F427C1E|nr:LytTR family DNA-binding domain-containing protein [Muricauda sp. SCSIO 65647]UJH69148.1 LytTR family DNA-binding domain-containing protein [Muricauda sp. SCSIO 65647]
MNCIIIDDEPLALGIIKSYCEEVGGIQVLDTYTNPLDSVEIMQSGEVDLVFLDIQMPQISGIEFVKSLDKKPHFIFTTAYPQYAIEGFNLNAIDYLVKPIPFVRFVKAVNRVKERIALKVGSHQKTGNVSSADGLMNDNKFIFVKSDYGNVKIELENIRYIQGLKDYLKINVIDSKPILTLMNFKDMEDKLASNDFIRVHRSYIINVNSIDSIQKSKILMHGERIPIGESFREGLMRRIGLQ